MSGKEHETQRKFSRRNFLLGSAAVTGTALAELAAHKLNNGIIRNPPSLDLEYKKVNLEPLRAPAGSFLSMKQEIIQIADMFMYFNSERELIVQYEDVKFDPERDYPFIHRSGQKHYLETALKKGALGIDLDLSDNGQGNFYVEHGNVIPIGYGSLSTEIVVDIGEGEVSFAPLSAPEVIQKIGERNNPSDPYIIEMELKRGTFDRRPAIENTFHALREYKIPTRIFSPEQGKVENFYSVGLRLQEDFTA